MERVHDEIGMIPIDDHQFIAPDFGLIDFMDEANFDQFVDLIRGENDRHDQPLVNFNTNIQGYYNFGDQQNHIIADHGQFFQPVPHVELFDSHDINVAHHNINNNSFDLLSLQNNACQINAADDEEEIMDGNESSATTTTTATATATIAGGSDGKKNGNKVDRSRTLISERRRRGRMKEKLYALRSLVPNITKMDKASIVGDAVLYVQDLQMQAKKLKAEIAGLESSFTGGDKFKQTQIANKINVTSFYPITKKIFKMDVFQVEERGLYVRIVSNIGKGVAVSLFKALESLTSFNVHTSNLNASTQNYVFTFTLHIVEEKMDADLLHKLELRIASVFLNHGFEFVTSQSNLS